MNLGLIWVVLNLSIFLLKEFISIPSSFVGIDSQFASNAEKAWIVFYIGMKDVVPSHLGKDKLDDIIKEEMSHIRLLSKKLLEQ